MAFSSRDIRGRLCPAAWSAWCAPAFSAAVTAFPLLARSRGAGPPTLAPSYIPPPQGGDAAHSVRNSFAAKIVFSLTLVHLSGHSFIPIRTHAYLFPTLSKNIFLINPVLETELMFTSEMA